MEGRYKKTESGRNYFVNLSKCHVKKIMWYVIKNKPIKISDVFPPNSKAYNNFIKKNSAKVNDDGFIRSELIEEIRLFKNNILDREAKKMVKYDDNNNSNFINVEVIDELAYDKDPKYYARYIHCVEHDWVDEESPRHLYLIPDDNFSLENIYHNFIVESQIKYLFNPKIEVQKYLKTNKHTIQCVNMNIVSEINITESLDIKSKIHCIGCSMMSEYSDFHIQGKNRSFECANIKDDGEVCATRIKVPSVKGVVPVSSKNVYLYEVEFKTDNGDKNMIISSMTRLDIGVSTLQILFNSSRDGDIMVVSKNTSDMHMMKSYFNERSFTGVIPNHLPQHNLFRIYSELKNILSKYGDIHLTDNGAMVALVEIMQFFEISYTNNKMFHAMIVADTSKGKSLQTKVWGTLLLNALYVENCQRLSLPRLAGGMADITIGGRPRRVFINGMLSNFKHIIFNEALDVLTSDRVALQTPVTSMMKAMLDSPDVSNNVIGGRNCKRNATITIIGNYPSQTLNYNFNRIRRTHNRGVINYNEQLSFTDDEEGVEKKNKDFFNEECNVMRKIEHIEVENKSAADAYKKFQAEMENKDVDMMTGLSLPVMRRFPIFIKVQKDGVGTMKDIDKEIKNSGILKKISNMNRNINFRLVHKEIIEHFPKMNFTKEVESEVMNYLYSIENKYPKYKKREVSRTLMYDMILMLMTLNKENHISKATKEVFEMFCAKPIESNFVSSREFNLQDPICTETKDFIIKLIKSSPKGELNISEVDLDKDLLDNLTSLCINGVVKQASTGIFIMNMIFDDESQSYKIGA